MHLVTCSLFWVRCLFDRLTILYFGGKWPLKWKFSKMSLWIPRRDTEVHFLTKNGENRPLQSCRTVAWITTQKNMHSVDSSQPPFCPKWADRSQNSLNVVTPWHVHVYRIWSGSAALCRTYYRKIDFSAQKTNTMMMIIKCTVHSVDASGGSQPRPLLAVPNVTVHPSMASVPVTVLLYNGPLLCGLNVPIKG